MGRKSKLAALLCAIGCALGASGCGEDESTSATKQDAGSDALGQLDSASDANPDSGQTIDCSRVGCSPPPMCEEGCTAECGCCSCGEGETIAVEGGVMLCQGGCYVIAPADAGTDA